MVGMRWFNSLDQNHQFQINTATVLEWRFNKFWHKMLDDTWHSSCFKSKSLLVERTAPLPRPFWSLFCRGTGDPTKQIDINWHPWSVATLAAVWVLFIPFRPSFYFYVRALLAWLWSCKKHFDPWVHRNSMKFTDHACPDHNRPRVTICTRMLVGACWHYIWFTMFHPSDRRCLHCTRKYRRLWRLSCAQYALGMAAPWPRKHKQTHKIIQIHSKSFKHV